MKDFKLSMTPTGGGGIKINLAIEVFPDGHGVLISPYDTISQVRQPFADPFQGILMITEILRLMWKIAKREELFY